MDELLAIDPVVHRGIQAELRKQIERVLKQMLADFRARTLNLDQVAWGLGAIQGYYDVLVSYERVLRKREE